MSMLFYMVHTMLSLPLKDINKALKGQYVFLTFF